VLSGLVVNVPCPSQVSEQEYQVSADFWHDTRQELRRRFGEHLFVLPQCAAAGDQSPRPLVGKPPKSECCDYPGATGGRRSPTASPMPLPQRCRISNRSVRHTGTWYRDLRCS